MEYFLWNIFYGIFSMEYFLWNAFYGLLQTLGFAESNTVFTQRNLMVETDEFAVFLPEYFFYKAIFLAVPGGEVVQEESAGISGIGIQTPEGVV